MLHRSLQVDYRYQFLNSAGYLPPKVTLVHGIVRVRTSKSRAVTDRYPTEKTTIDVIDNINEFSII